MLVGTPLQSDDTDKHEQAFNVFDARSHGNPKEKKNFSLVHFQVDRRFLLPNLSETPLRKSLVFHMTKSRHLI